MPFHSSTHFRRIAPTHRLEYIPVSYQYYEGYGGDVVGFAYFGEVFGV